MLQKLIVPNNILLIRPGGIGDAAIFASSVINIKNYLPDSHITILAERRNCGIFSLLRQVDELFCYDIPQEFFKVFLKKYDVVIDSEQSHYLSAVVARFVKAPVKIGFDTNERHRMFTHPISYNLEEYESFNFFALLKPLGIDSQSNNEAVTLSIPSYSVVKADNMLQSLDSKPFITIFPGASIPEKRWGVEHFRQVAKILSASEIKIVVIGGKEDRQLGDIIAGDGFGLNLAGLTSLPETAAVIQKSTLLLSGDSGVLHIAVGLGIPTVALFGPGRVSKWAPRGANHIVINKKLPCSPCTFFGNTPPCPINVQCMQDITVDEVVRSVKTLFHALRSSSKIF